MKARTLKAHDANVEATYVNALTLEDELDALMDATIDAAGNIDQDAYNAALDSINAAYVKSEQAHRAYHRAVDEANTAKADHEWREAARAEWLAIWRPAH